MSGHKHATISISQAEYQRLHDAEMRLRLMQTAPKQEATSLSNHTLAAMDSYYRLMESRQEDFISQVMNVDNQIALLENETSQTLVRQQQVLQDALKTAIADNSETTIQYINRIENELALELDQALQTRDDALESLFLHAQQDLHDNRRKYNLVRRWLEAARLIKRYITENYDADKFLPGELSKLIRRSKQAEAILAQGFIEASFSLGIDVYTCLSDMRLQLEQMHADFELTFQSTYRELRCLAQAAIQSQSTNAIDMNGQIIEQRVDVDYWVSGQYNPMLQEIEQLLSSLESNKPRLTSKDLEMIRLEKIPAYYQRIDEFLHQARMETLSSQLRMNIADIVVNVLSKQGYSLRDSDYLRMDMRGTYYARVGNLDGSEIIISVDPGSDDDISNQLHLVSEDVQEKTIHEIQQRATEIKRALMQTGLEVSTFERGSYLGDQALDQKPAAYRKVREIKPEYQSYTQTNV